MSNYTNENLINVPSSNVPAGTLAMKVGDNIFTAGNVIIGGTEDYYKCSSVIQPSTQTFYTVSGAGITDINGDYEPTEDTSNGQPVYSLTAGNTTYYLFLSGYNQWGITSSDITDQNFDFYGDTYYTSDDNMITSEWYSSGQGNDTTPPNIVAQSREVSGTWTGYKAIFNAVTGTYTFDSSVTSGLSYGSGFIPAVDGIYADGALVRAELYQGWEAPAGAVLYAPLATSAAAAVTGQTMTTTGSPVFALYQGIPCAQFSGSDMIGVGNTNIPYSESPMSISLWINASSNPAQDSGVFNIGGSSWGYKLCIIYNSTGIDLAAGGPYYGWGGAGVPPAPVTFNGTWKHVVVIFGQGEYGERPASVYVNGVLAQSGTFNYSENAYSSTPPVYIASYDQNPGVPNFTGRMAAVRVYPSALTAAEIASLYSEFTPSA